MSNEVASRSADVQANGDRTASIPVRFLTWISLAAITVTVVTFTLLHLLPPTSAISPVHRTISEYALTTSAWAFNLAVVALAGASVATFAGAIMVRQVKPVSGATVGGVLWVAGLLTLVNFPKHNWALGAISSSGQVHRMASLVAFLALPVAVMALARRRGGAHRATARLAFWSGAVSLLWFVPILIAIAVAPRAWWTQIPLGLVERGMALTEVTALVLVTVLVRRSARSVPQS
ncbi:Protein of unknown function [Nakamurella panacisegetis]|uniref:DUF998 domain-containing protein n=1 Tax=Nakamurella panacisegetis TaxID=1090615 RepID=A0A1H0IP35_9ACTN|nr:DUF998 domain-containing protein [Nakamurella panacisegetis]SDO33156.1 Protein of unknown function [Nakamurella panacisegetis]